MNNAVADFHFLVFVHERLGDVGIMAVLDRGAADERRPIRNRLFLRRRGKIFTRRKDRRGGANRAHRRHVNVLRGDGDERAGRTGVCVDEGVSGDFRLIERVHDIGRGIESPAVSVHLENNRRGFVALGCFDCAPQERQQRGRDFALQRHDDDVAFVDDLARVTACRRIAARRECSTRNTRRIC